MRINLNFKDANIRKTDKSKFLIEFNLSKMIKPRLSADARMYIEHFNLGEFIDDRFGRNKGNLYGYFELRCDNIDSNDFDSEYGNTGNTIIYTSPLNNFATFTNNDPMFVSNFKISQNFLRDRLVFQLNIFDKNGDPFDLSTETEEETQTTGPEHATYKTKTDTLNTLITNLEIANILLDTTKNDLANDKIAESYVSTLLQEKQTELFKKMDAITSLGTRSVGDKIKISILKHRLQTYTINDFIYIFEDFLPLNIGKKPYQEIKTELDLFYGAFISYINYKLRIEQLIINEDNINSNETNIWYGSTSTFNPATINVKSSLKQLVPYEVVVPSGTNKTGKIDIKNFNSVLHNASNTVINNVVPDAGSDNELVINDVLIINKSNFEEITIEKFEYLFFKSVNTSIPGVTLNNRANPSRFSLKVSRDSDVYTYEFTNDIETKGLKDNDTITILGSQLGGIDSTNDLVITVNKVYVPLISKQYPFTNFTDVSHTDNGTFNINIERDNPVPPITIPPTIKRNAKYNIIGSPDFTKTKNYIVGELITIDGADLDGITSTNDVTLTVNSVYTAEKPYNVDETKIKHSIPQVNITSFNSKVFRKDASNNDVDVTTGLDYEIQITSDDGTYEVLFVSSSVGFENDDIIRIPGSILTGEDGVNDLDLKITSVTAENRIDVVDIEASGTYIARQPTAYEFEITQKLNEPVYGVKYESGGIFQVGDILLIDGSDIGGTTGTNDLTITVLTINTGFILTFDFNGISDNDTGEIGEIISVDITGTPIIDDSDGSWLQSDTTSTGTGVTISSLTVPDLQITLNNVLVNGVKKIESDIVTAYAEIQTAKGNLVKSKNVYVLDLNNQIDKLKCINCSLVLYDEIPSHNEVSKDTLTANTYSRYTGCAFKRI